MQIWILDPIPGWSPSRSPMSRLQQAPKHQLADPALAARILGLTARTLAGPTGAHLAGPRGRTASHAVTGQRSPRGFRFGSRVGGAVRSPLGETRQRAGLGLDQLPALARSDEPGQRRERAAPVEGQVDP